MSFPRKDEDGKPVDFSFRKMKMINVEKFLEDIGLEGARFSRVNGVPDRGPNQKFLTKSIWLNNNKLKNIEHVDELARVVLEQPEQLSWLDFSFNHIQEIHECILSFQNLKILYFHGNCISDLNEVYKLRPLKHLRTVTFHGNPISNSERYRGYVVSVLPQIVNLDFSPIISTERSFPPPIEALKKLKEEQKSSKHKDPKK